MFSVNINPVAFSVFGIDVRYYGLIYVIGILAVLVYTFRKVKERKVRNADGNSIYDLFIVSLVSMIVGARLFYVLFYEPAYYLQNPLEIPAVWNGGLSFHGGLFGGLLAGFLFCRKKMISFLEMSDIMLIPVALALFLGRIANFINGELYGMPSTLPWAVEFPGVDFARHPTQLYESLKNLIIFFVLLNVDRIIHKNDKNASEAKNAKKNAKQQANSNVGTITALFLILYGTIRFFIEFLKDLPILFFGLKTGQLLCILMVAAGIVLLVWARKKNKSRVKKSK